MLLHPNRTYQPEQRSEKQSTTRRLGETWCQIDGVQKMSGQGVRKNEMRSCTSLVRPLDIVGCWLGWELSLMARQERHVFHAPCGGGVIERHTDRSTLYKLVGYSKQ